MAQVGQTLRENAVPEVSQFAQEYSLVGGGMSLTIPHGMPKRPRRVWLQLKNITPELNYAVGDHVEIGNQGISSVSANANNIQVSLSATPSIVDLVTNIPTAVAAAKWNLVVRAELS